jgi:hypothetical protein
MAGLLGYLKHRSPYEADVEGNIAGSFEEFRQICEPKHFKFQLIGSTILTISGAALLTTSLVFTWPIPVAVTLITLGSIATTVGCTIIAGSCLSRNLCSCFSGFFRKDDTELMLQDAGLFLSFQQRRCC